MFLYKQMSIDCDMNDFFNLVKNFTKSITFCVFI